MMFSACDCLCMVYSLESREVMACFVLVGGGGGGNCMLQPYIESATTLSDY